MEWKQFRDYNYEASNTGQVRTIPHIKIKSNGIKHTVVQKTLRPAIDNKGYQRCALIVNGKLTTFKVHRIIAEMFINNPNNYPQVNHKNGIKTDNRVENLEWCNNSQNVKHAFDKGLIKNIFCPVKDKKNFKRGVKNIASKLNEEIVKKCRELRKQGNSYQKIADQFGVNKKTMINAIKGITWANI